MGQGIVMRLWDIENIQKARKCCSGDRKIAIGLFCLHKLTYAFKRNFFYHFIGSEERLLVAIEMQANYWKEGKMETLVSLLDNRKKKGTK
jgi:coenzyme F420-reducing hydrogenase beta subunit